MGYYQLFEAHPQLIELRLCNHRLDKRTLCEWIKTAPKNLRLLDLTGIKQPAYISSPTPLPPLPSHHQLRQQVRSIAPHLTLIL